MKFFLYILYLLAIFTGVFVYSKTPNYLVGFTTGCVSLAILQIANKL